MNYKFKNIHTTQLLKEEAGFSEKSVLSVECVLRCSSGKELCVYIFSDTSSNGSEESSDSSDDELIGPPLPPQMAEESVKHMEENISRLPPPLYEEEEDDDDDGDSEDDEVSISVVISEFSGVVSLE